MAFQLRGDGKVVSELEQIFEAGEEKFLCFISVRRE